MQFPQLLICEADDRLKDLLQATAATHRWALRQLRQPESCLRLLRRGRPSILVLRVGRRLERELALLERVSWLYPDTAAVVVGDGEHAPLADLAWNLGARYVLFPPQPRDRLLDVVAGLMGEAGGPKPTPEERKR
ncbi:MAG TPA: hypothetical protein VFA26_04475 [Gemmataceae bacterium]|nr:hypothetical protein [Gemmataceae bacterium]